MNDEGMYNQSNQAIGVFLLELCNVQRPILRPFCDIVIHMPLSPPLPWAYNLPT